MRVANGTGRGTEATTMPEGVARGASDDPFHGPADDVDLDDLDDASDRDPASRMPPATGLPFAGALRRAYEVATASSRAAEMRLAAVVGLLGYDAFSFFDASLVPDLGRFPSATRMLVVTPVAVLLPLALVRTSPVWLERFAACVTGLAALLPVSMVYLSHSPDAPYATTAAVLTNLFATVTLRVRFRYAVASTLATVTALSAALASRPDLDPGLRAALATSMALCGAFGLMASGRLERAERASTLAASREGRRVLRLRADRAALAALSSTDALTGLANRREFDRRLAASWDGLRRGDRAFALLMVDVDRFKEVNDALGHLAGDERLVAVASILRDVVVRRGDVVARFGGEEFAILLADCSVEDAARVGEDVRRAVRAAAIPRPRGGALTVSVGVAAAAPGSHERPSDVVAQADRNLYRAKAQGRDIVAA